MAKNKPSVSPLPRPTNLALVRAAFAYSAQEPDEISFGEGDLMVIIDKSEDDWWKVRCRGKVGLAPANYLKTDAATDMQPLHDACRRGNLDSVEECLLNRIPVNLPDRSGNTPLHWAAHSGHTDCLNRLLAVPHIKLNATNRLGDTPLHQAAYKGHVAGVRLLRAKGANLNCVNAENLNPLDLATDPETKNELILWKKSLDENKPSQGGDYEKDDYEHSDDEEED